MMNNTTYFRAIFSCFCVVPCNDYVVPCNNYVAPCKNTVQKEHYSPDILTTYASGKKELDYYRYHKIYIEGTGLSLRSGRPSENRIPHKIISFSSCFYITVATSHEMQEKVLSFLLNILSLREVIWTI